MMYCKVEKMIETMDKVVEKTLHLVAPDSLKCMNSDDLEMLVATGGGASCGYASYYNGVRPYFRLKK